MKKTLVCIFAHPDDEAFGPGGTIATFTKDHDVYILCATRGEAGQNHHKDKEKKIDHIREQELISSSKILGVKGVFFLDFIDGTLNNQQYHLVAEKIKQILDTLKPSSLLTFEPRGVSGHLDHIAVSMITTFVFYRLSSAKTLFYYCHSDDQIKIMMPLIKDYFVYFPPGYPPNQIGKTVDIASVWETKIKSIMCHQSQKGDINKILPIFESLPKKEYFLVIKK